MIRRCLRGDYEGILGVINEASRVYEGVIPPECWRRPYMSADTLREQILAGVEFFGFDEGGELLGVMGIQHFPDVTLIRHAYVLSSEQGKGVGGKLLKFLLAKTEKPVLIGTWRDTQWSINFYEKHGFRVLDKNMAATLLKKYWVASDIHFANSVVLADNKF
jgi:GNAT superfamily N-acetyltransferase